MGIITDVCKAWIVYHKTVRNFLTMVNHLLTDWLNFTTFGITSISVGFPFFGNTKTTMTVKNSDIRKSYIFWDFLYGFAFFQHTLKSLKILASKIRMICTNLPLLALDNQPEPCLWQFPFDFRQQLQTSCNTKTTILRDVGNSFGSQTLLPAQLSFTKHTFLNINLSIFKLFLLFLFAVNYECIFNPSRTSVC
jgi:hypothetical protein